MPSTALVTDGPFRYTRNPLYIGLTLLYAGAALLIPSTWPLILLVPVGSAAPQCARRPFSARTSASSSSLTVNGLPR